MKTNCLLKAKGVHQTGEPPARRFSTKRATIDGDFSES